MEEKDMKTDFQYFAEKVFKIKDPNGQLKDFKLCPFQVQLWNLIKRSIDENKPLNIAKLRSRRLI